MLVGVVVDDADGVGRQLGSKQVDEVHLAPGERITDARTRHIALRPRAGVDGTVVARVDVVVQTVDVVLVEDERPSTSSSRQGRVVVGDGRRRRGWSRRRPLSAAL